MEQLSSFTRMEVISAKPRSWAEAAKKHHETNLCGVSSAALPTVSLAAHSSVKRNCPSSTDQTLVTEGSSLVPSESSLRGSFCCCADDLSFLNSQEMSHLRCLFKDVDFTPICSLGRWFSTFLGSWPFLHILNQHWGPPTPERICSLEQISAFVFSNFCRLNK